MGPSRQEALYHAVKCSNLGTDRPFFGGLFIGAPSLSNRAHRNNSILYQVYMERARANLQYKRSLDLEGEWCQVLDVTVGAPRGVKKRQFGVQQRLNDSFFFRS